MKRAQIHRFIDRLGGRVVVAQRLGLTVWGPKAWQQIPVKHVPELLKMALEADLKKKDGSHYTLADLRPDYPWDVVKTLP